MRTGVVTTITAEAVMASKVCADGEEKGEKEENGKWKR